MAFTDCCTSSDLAEALLTSLSPHINLPNKTEVKKLETAEKAQETEGELDTQFIVLAEDEEGFALVQFESKLNTLIYTGRKSQQGRFFKSAIPRQVFFDLAKKAEE